MSRDIDIETPEVLGFLGDEGVLFCSRACAVRAGEREPTPVDGDEYASFAESGRAAAGGLCPVCGAEYPLGWPEESD
jgi:hypothetical protein